MTGTSTLRVGTWVGFGVFLILGLLPSVLYGGYIGLLVTRFVLGFEDTSSTAARTVIVSSAGLSVIVTCLIFTLCGRAVGRRIVRRRAERAVGPSSAERVSVSPPPPT